MQLDAIDSKKSNKINLLLVFCVLIKNMPDDFRFMQLHKDFENGRMLPSKSKRCYSALFGDASDSGTATVSRLRTLCRLRSFLQAGFIQRPAIRHPYHHVSG